MATLQELATQRIQAAQPRFQVQNPQAGRLPPIHSYKSNYGEAGASAGAVLSMILSRMLPQKETKEQRNERINTAYKRLLRTDPAKVKELQATNPSFQKQLMWMAAERPDLFSYDEKTRFTSPIRSGMTKEEISDAKANFELEEWKYKKGLRKTPPSGADFGVIGGKSEGPPGTVEERETEKRTALLGEQVEQEKVMTKIAPLLAELKVANAAMDVEKTAALIQQIDDAMKTSAAQRNLLTQQTRTAKAEADVAPEKAAAEVESIEAGTRERKANTAYINSKVSEWALRSPFYQKEIIADIAVKWAQVDKLTSDKAKLDAELAAGNVDPVQIKKMQHDTYQSTSDDIEKEFPSGMVQSYADQYAQKHILNAEALVETTNNLGTPLTSDNGKISVPAALADPLVKQKYGVSMRKAISAFYQTRNLDDQKRISAMLQSSFDHVYGNHLLKTVEQKIPVVDRGQYVTIDNQYVDVKGKSVMKEGDRVYLMEVDKDGHSKKGLELKTKVDKYDDFKDPALIRFMDITLYQEVMKIKNMMKGYTSGSEVTYGGY